MSKLFREVVEGANEFESIGDTTQSPRARRKYL